MAKHNLNLNSTVITNFYPFSSLLVFYSPCFLLAHICIFYFKYGEKQIRQHLMYFPLP
jgi:hypothetical protein